MKRLAGILAISSILLTTVACQAPEQALVDRDEVSTLFEDGKRVDEKLGEVIERLTRACMEDLGFTVHPETVENSGTAPVPADSDDFEVWMGVRYMYLTDSIRVSGYQASPHEQVGDLSSLAEPSEFEKLPSEEQESYRSALDGSSGDGSDDTNHLESVGFADGTVYYYPVAGCHGETLKNVHDDDVYGYEQASYFAYDGLGNVGHGEVRADHRVIEAHTHWSDCMAAKGYSDLASPFDAWAHAQTLYDDAGVKRPTDPGFDAVRSEETALAISDYECNVDVGLDETMVEVFWEHIGQYFAQYETQIYGWKELADAALERAQQLLRN